MWNTRVGLRRIRHRCQVSRTEKRDVPENGRGGVPVARAAPSRARRSRTEATETRETCARVRFARVTSQPASRHPERGGRFDSWKADGERDGDRLRVEPRAGRPEPEPRERATRLERRRETEKAQVRAEQTGAGASAGFRSTPRDSVRRCRRRRRRRVCRDRRARRETAGVVRGEFAARRVEAHRVQRVARGFQKRRRERRGHDGRRGEERRTRVRVRLRIVRLATVRREMASRARRQQARVGERERARESRRLGLGRDGAGASGAFDDSGGERKRRAGLFGAYLRFFRFPPAFAVRRALAKFGLGPPGSGLDPEAVAVALAVGLPGTDPAAALRVARCGL